MADTPCVIFGPGDVKVAHSADEYVPLDEVETCARVLAAWVRARARGRCHRRTPPDVEPSAAAVDRGAPGEDDAARPARRPGRRPAARAPRSWRPPRPRPEPRLAAAAELQIRRVGQALDPGPLGQRQARG